MTTSHEERDLSVRSEPAGMTLQTEEAKATAAEITADNEALEENYQAAEVRAEATAEQAHQLAQVTEEVLEEIKEAAEQP
jgi:hypothetical protein